ncbi:hypothetical protein GCM10023187_22720 [Nibrella viscosa]|uniref:Uncharacterized protein n=1 Tax=Nibrella viscosa TaxID=1084524 RepID=A0ABP8KEB9_9BACT
MGCDSAAQREASVARPKQEAKAALKPATKEITPAGKRKPIAARQDTVRQELQPAEESLVNVQEQPADEPQESAIGWDNEREELRKNIKAEIEAIETKIDDIKGEIDGAGPDVRTRCQRAISELRYERAKLSTQLKVLGVARKDNWEKVRNRINNAIQATDERVTHVSEQIAR